MIIHNIASAGITTVTIPFHLISRISLHKMNPIGILRTKLTVTTVMMIIILLSAVLADMALLARLRRIILTELNGSITPSSGIIQIRMTNISICCCW